MRPSTDDLRSGPALSISGRRRQTSNACWTQSAASPRAWRDSISCLGGIDLTEILIVLVVLISSLSVHEAAHAFAADRLGDPTARHLGRLSLNPAVHVDPIGTLLFP